MISANCADLDVSRLVGQRLGAYVKELIYDTLIYADLDRQQHDEEVFKTIARMDPSKVPLALHGLESSYAAYRIQPRDMTISRELVSSHCIYTELSRLCQTSKRSIYLVHTNG